MDRRNKIFRKFNSQGGILVALYFHFEMKSYYLIFLILACVSCSGTESSDSQVKTAVGTVKYISLEGGFYGIVTDDSQHLDPLNLPKEFQRDGIQIYFKYVEKKDMASFHMWGTIIEITEIHELN